MKNDNELLGEMILEVYEMWRKGRYTIGEMNEIVFKATSAFYERRSDNETDALL
jgi:hypothetical protein